MKINKAIKQIMKSEGVSQRAMAAATGRADAKRVGATLNSGNMKFDTAVKMLDVLGYEIVLRRKDLSDQDQIVVDQKD